MTRLKPFWKSRRQRHDQVRSTVFSSFWLMLIKRRITLARTWLFIIARRHMMHSRTSSVASPRWYFLILRCNRLLSARPRVKRLKAEVSSLYWWLPFFERFKGEERLWLVLSVAFKSFDPSISLETNTWNSFVFIEEKMGDHHLVLERLPHHFNGSHQVIEQNIQSIVVRIQKLMYPSRAFEGNA